MILNHRGGIRLKHRKDRTRRKSLAELDTLPKEIILFLRQSTGEEATPVVRVHQSVQAEELVAQSQGEGTPVYASLSGTVVAIEPRPDFSGTLHPAIVIQVDSSSTTSIPSLSLDWETISPDEMIRQTRDFGLVEQVGDPVPLHTKILDARGKVDTLIINGTECQPYLTATHRLGLERGRDLIAGGQLLARILGVRSTIFAITGDQIISIERLERDLRRSLQSAQVGREMRVKTLSTRYPLYHDNQIVLAVTGREIPPAQTSVEVGCQVFSLGAVCALGRAFLSGRPLTHTAVTVSGLAVSQPRNLWVPLGTSLHTLLENCDGVQEEPVLTLVGGLLMGQTVAQLHAPVESSTQGLLCLLPSELPPQRKQHSCLQCGSCIEVCPMRLTPVFVGRAVTKKQLDKLVSLHPQDCIQCGACASVCPSHIPLMNTMQKAVAMMHAKEVIE